MSDLNIASLRIRRRSSAVFNIHKNNIEDDLHAKTRIICTIGPKSNQVDTLCDMLDAGMSCARLNTAHGTFEFHQAIIDNVRKAASIKKTLCAIMLDIKGPEMRTCKLAPNPDLHDAKEWNLVAGNPFTFTTDVTVLGNDKIVATTYSSLPSTVKPGSLILISDGLLCFRVTAVDLDKTLVHCFIENSGSYGENKNMNIPGHQVDLPAVTKKDKKFVEFGMKNGVEFIAGSFIRKPQDVIDIRNLPNVAESGVRMIAKIENQEGIDNIDGIIKVSDAIMVARGDLGVEIPLQCVAAAQKDIIRRCNRCAKPVITATQMLDSMIKNPRPTRAEVSDVYNAVMDGSDSVMLSGETANGLFPVQAIHIMSDICLEAEKHIDRRRFLNYCLFRTNKFQTEDPIMILKVIAQSVAHSAVTTARAINAKLIVALSSSGMTARLVSMYYPDCPILAVTPDVAVAHALLLSRDVTPYLVSSITGAEETASKGITRAIQLNILKPDDLVVITSGSLQTSSGITTMMRIAKITHEKNIQFVLTPPPS